MVSDFVCWWREVDGWSGVRRVCLVGRVDDVLVAQR